MPAVSSVVMPEFERRSTDAARVRVVVLGALARQRLTAPLSLGAGLLAWPARRSRWLSIGAQTGPRIGVQQGPLIGDKQGRQRSPRRSWSGLRSRGERGSVDLIFFLWSGAVLEAPALVAGLDDIAMMREAVEQRGRHLRVPEHARMPPFPRG